MRLELTRARVSCQAMKQQSRHELWSYAALVPYMCALSIIDTVVTNPHMCVSYQSMEEYSRHELWRYAALGN